MAKKLGRAVKNTIPAIAEAMEKLRADMMIFRYQLRHIGRGRQRMKDYIHEVQPKLVRYTELVQEVRGKSREDCQDSRPDSLAPPPLADCSGTHPGKALASACSGQTDACSLLPGTHWSSRALIYPSRFPCRCRPIDIGCCQRPESFPVLCFQYILAYLVHFPDMLCCIRGFRHDFRIAAARSYSIVFESGISR